MDFPISRMFPDGSFVSFGDAEALLFYFFLYAFAGLLLENTHNRVLGGSFWKENFLRGPYKPMYGLAPLCLLLLTGPGTGFWTRAFLCLAVPTLVEYASGALLKGMFHRTYWDYSGLRYQLQGHVCAGYSLCWLGLCLMLLYFLHPAAATFYGWLSPLWHQVWYVAALWFAGDVVWTTVTCLKGMPVAAK